MSSNSVQRSLIEVAESLARRMGFGSADEAEAAKGVRAWGKMVEDEARAAAPKSTELPRAFEATGRTEANAARDAAAAQERKGLQQRIAGNINKSIDARDVSKYNEPTPAAVAPGATEAAPQMVGTTLGTGGKALAGIGAGAVAAGAAMSNSSNPTSPSSSGDPEYDRRYSERKSQLEKENASRTERGLRPYSPEQVEDIATKHASAESDKRNEAASSLRNSLYRQWGKEEGEKRFREKYPDWTEPKKASSLQETVAASTTQTQQTEPTANAEGPAATTPGKGVGGGVRNISEKQSGVKPESKEEKKVKSNLDLYEEQVNIFNREGFNTDTVQQQLDKARQAYEKDRDLNRTLGLAQLVAQSIARMGAAVEGNKRGRYIGDINSPSVDYDARTAEARADYRDQVSDISARQKENVETEKYKQGQKLGALEKRIQNDRMQYQEQQQNIRAQAAETRQDARSQQARNDRLDDLAAQEEKKLLAQKRAVENLAGAINSSDKKQQAQIPTLVSAAGTDQAEFEKMKNEAPQEPGTFFGTNPSTALQSDYVKQTLLAPIEARLRELKEERRGYASMGAGKSQQVSAPQQQQPAPTVQQTTGQQPPSNVVSVKHKPTGETVLMQKDVFEARYASNPEYTIVK